MIKAVPFILTSGNKNFSEFIAQPFTVNMLSADKFFDGWIEHNHAFTNNEGYIIEFHSDYYIVKKKIGSSNYRLSLPKTINDFINDMYRLGIQLYWTQWIDDNFEPKDYLDKNEIEEYYRNLLGKMGKSHELL